MCKDQLCVKHAKFLSPFLSINHQCTKNIKPELDIVLIVKKKFWGGEGSWRVWGGSFPPPHPPVDETLDRGQCHFKGHQEAQPHGAC